MNKEEQKEQDTQIAAQTSENAQIVNTGLVKLLPQSGIDSKPVLSKNPESAIIETKRKRTKGESLFDWSVYGGFGFAGNEVVSGIIQNRTIEHDGKWFNYYKGAVNGMHKLFGKTVENPTQWNKWIRRPIDVFVMTIGGNLLVLPIKWCEDGKSGLVRFADKILHGKDADKDPEIKNAHEEMDAAPKQSWGSLGKGRAVVIGAAIGVDMLAGSNDALTTKLLDKTPAKDWSSMHRINVKASRWVGKKAADWFGFDKEGAAAIRLNEQNPLSKYEIVTKRLQKDPYVSEALKALPSEGKIASTGKTYGFLLVLSAVLAGGFYVTSHMFAHGREKKKQHMDEHKATGTIHIGLDNMDAATSNTPTDQLEKSDDKPTSTITQAQLVKRAEHQTQEATTAR